jgi:hypothetical protein
MASPQAIEIAAAHERYRVARGTPEEGIAYAALVYVVQRIRRETRR